MGRFLTYGNNIFFTHNYPCTIDANLNVRRQSGRWYGGGVNPAYIAMDNGLGQRRYGATPM